MSKETDTKTGEEKYTLRENEPHPAAFSAMEYLKGFTLRDYLLWEENFASSALAGNRTAEICLETLRRLKEKELVSDRYLLGLAWIIKEGENDYDRKI